MKTGSQIAAIAVPKLSPKLAIGLIGEPGSQLAPPRISVLAQPEFLLGETGEILTDSLALPDTVPLENHPSLVPQSKSFVGLIDVGPDAQLPASSEPALRDRIQPENPTELPEIQQRTASLPPQFPPIKIFESEAETHRSRTWQPTQSSISAKIENPTPITADHNFRNATEASKFVPSKDLLVGEKLPNLAQPDVGHVVLSDTVLAAPARVKSLQEAKSALALRQKPEGQITPFVVPPDTVKVHSDLAGQQQYSKRSPENNHAQGAAPAAQTRQPVKSDNVVPTPEISAKIRQPKVAIPVGLSGEKIIRADPLAPTPLAIEPKVLKNQTAQESRPNITTSNVTEPRIPGLDPVVTALKPKPQNQPVKQIPMNAQLFVQEQTNVKPFISAPLNARVPPMKMPSPTSPKSLPVTPAASIVQTTIQPGLAKPLEKQDSDKPSEISAAMIQVASLSAAADVQVVKALPQAVAPGIIQTILNAVSTHPDRPVELMLNPEELGRVRLTMQSNEGNMAVMISVERPETLELLRRNIDQLAAQLREIGYQNLSFDFAGEQGAFDGGAEDQQTSTGQPSNSADISPENISTGPVYISGKSQTGVDIRL